MPLSPCHQLDLVAYIEGQTNKITRYVPIAIDCITGLVLVIIFLDVNTQHLEEKELKYDKFNCLYPKGQASTLVIVLLWPQPVPASGLNL